MEKMVRDGVCVLSPQRCVTVLGRAGEGDVVGFIGRSCCNYDMAAWVWEPPREGVV